ncbi:alpha/beta hydrolase [Actinomyces sp. 594]|uniref:alpha/beta hydrolase n=1 Tax=Actinomyces sp. 594 TaxID=2057793 RepID=UPI001C57597D|nr:alpha/beta hydrolase fold domain-containing protein [Actinomyces sp. 594]MBW3068494.1 alpha/beta hydrolase [Actinomyces sp. 594]
MTDAPGAAPSTPQPTTTRDGVPVAPLAGGFLPPYAERLHLIADFPAPRAEDLAAADPAAAAGAPFAAEALAAMEAWEAPFGEPEPTRAAVEDCELPGPHGPIPVRIYRPEPGWAPPTPSPATDTGLRAGLVWYHGGAFIGGDLDMPEADAVARGLATRTGAVVVSVFYRLCTGGIHYPVPHDDAYAAYRWVREHATEIGIDAARIAVGGASAGGNLAAGVTLHGVDDGAAPWQALLAYPVAHGGLWPTPSPELAARLEQMPQILRLPTDVMAAMNTNYLGAPLDADAPAYAFPGDLDAARLEGWPATYIENCENDDLRASGEAFARQLRQAGADVEVLTCAGVPHGHLNAVGSPLTAASLDRFAARLGRG